MDFTDSSPPGARRPLQERGRRRVDAILDAAAAMLREVGLTGFTVHGVAARANTSIGSMYHFFPDGESVLQALGERHMASLDEILQRLRAMEPRHWGEMSLTAAVDEVLDPFLTYMETHPDLLALPHNPKHRTATASGHELDRLTLDMFRQFVDARTPQAPEDGKTLRALMMLGMIEGVATRAAGAEVHERPGLFRELKVCISAYLAAYEHLLPETT